MSKGSDKIYQMITDRILDLLKKGETPWRKPWKGAALPCNITGRQYSGTNLLILSMGCYSNPVFLTYNQAKKLGGYVKKGESPWPVIFWKFLEKEDTRADGKKVKSRIPFLRYFTVFNIEQTEGVELPEKLKAEGRDDVQVIEAAQAVVNGYDGPQIKHGGNRACYSPLLDEINMPRQDHFNSDADYYSTLFHEMGHSTGHQSRLDRKEGMENISFGSHNYSFEELIAELTAAFLSAHTGIDNATVENSAAYIQGWLKKLSDEPKWIVQAAGKAQKAANFIMTNGASVAKVEEAEAA